MVALANRPSSDTRAGVFRSLAWSALALLVGAALAAGGEDAPLRVHMISGSGEYKSEEGLTAWKTRLQQSYRVEVTMSLGRDGGQTLPDLDKLASADLMVVFCRRMKLPEDQMKLIRDWCAASKPVIGIRTASHAFQPWLAFDKEVLGGDYKGHGGSEPCAYDVVEKNRDHPILAGVQPWTAQGKLYTNPQLPAESIVLITGKGAKSTQPIAWAHPYGSNGRAFYTSLGYPHDFAEPNAQRLLDNAVAWTTARALVQK